MCAISRWRRMNSPSGSAGIGRSCRSLGTPSKSMRPVEDVTYGLGLSGADPAALTGALAEAAWRLATQPGVFAQSLGELALDEGAVILRLARGMLGADGTD